MPRSGAERRSGAGPSAPDAADAKRMRRALRLGLANEKILADHLQECALTRAELRAAQAATDEKVESLLTMQRAQTETLDRQTVTLNEIGEVLPWLKQSYASKKTRDRAWKAVGDFMLGMVRKNLDSVSGKPIFIAAGIWMSWKGVPWTEALRGLAKVVG